MWWWCLLVATATALSSPAPISGRAVNISNAWMLPQENFPVFYRYFRDRISWYEADAVCQFHHANLVTVDTTAQYDAVRAYLKELDISSGVWLGLIRSASAGGGARFLWTDYKPLSGDGYWSSPPEGEDASAPLCAVADPAADYRWEGRGCGGPTIASFICELPVPRWALGTSGCMVAALPAVTAVYLPEHGAVQLSADCGLAGVNSVLCHPDQSHRDLVKKLSCGEVDAYETNSTMSNTSATVSSSTRVTTTDTPLDASDRVPTFPSRSSLSILGIAWPRVLIEDNKLSNDIPQLGREEDESVHHNDDAQLKRMHEEVARHGDFETIFTQPTDRFVPPLVIAKSKIGDDMNALSVDEKHAQLMSEQRPQEAHIDAFNLNNTSYSAPIQGILSSTIASTVVGYMRESTQQNYLSTKLFKSIAPKKYNVNKHKYQRIQIFKPAPTGRKEQTITEIDNTESARETETTPVVNTEPTNVTSAAVFSSYTSLNATTLTKVQKVTPMFSSSTILAVTTSPRTPIDPIVTLKIMKQRTDLESVTIRDYSQTYSSTLQNINYSDFSTITRTKEDASSKITVEPLSLEAEVWETQAEVGNEDEGIMTRRPGRSRSRRLQEHASRVAHKFNPFRILG